MFLKNGVNGKWVVRAMVKVRFQEGHLGFNRPVLQMRRVSDFPFGCVSVLRVL